jgi:mannitol/fructose-specific phosphotransferase system IIA component (Ntr-type)
MQTKAKDYWKLFKPSACSIRLKGSTREEIFDEVVDTFIKAKVLTEELRKSAQSTLVDREAIASTGIGQNVAIPHVKLKGIEEAVVGLLLHPTGVEWRSLDGEDVQIFFVILRPERPGSRFDPERHLDMMKWISTLGRDADFRRFALGVANRTELVDLLKEKSEL